VVDAVLTSFGLLALLVATLGIANTLLMAITERTREIGVMMALGMTRSTVRRMFAVEAAAIGFFGGLAGTLAALVLGLGLSAVAGAYVPAAQELKGYSVFVFPWWLLLGTPIFSALIGGLAGILPANRAAQLDPIEALHHD
jgi:putative ABC transport system permease protein